MVLSINGTAQCPVPTYGIGYLRTALSVIVITFSNRMPRWARTPSMQDSERDREREINQNRHWRTRVKKVVFDSWTTSRAFCSCVKLCAFTKCVFSFVVGRFDHRFMLFIIQFNCWIMFKSKTNIYFVNPVGTYCKYRNYWIALSKV